MAQFLSQLYTKELSDSADQGRGQFKLTRALIFSSDILNANIRVPVGFKTDFASVPRLPFIFLVLGDRYRSPAVVHDYLYTKKFTTRYQADCILREACAVIDEAICRKPSARAWVRKVQYIVWKLQALQGFLRRNAMWLGLRLFGWSHWK